MRVLLAYAVAGLVMVVVAWVSAGLVFAGEAVQAVRVSAAVAYVVQLIAFGLLLATRDAHRLFVVGMVGGMGLRLCAVAVLGFWVTRTEAYPAAAFLVSLVAFLFLLLLLEPLFMRKGIVAT
ncbi:MAG: hypothetical protein ACREL7_17180 [Longimicrobiales bacterium]